MDLHFLLIQWQSLKIGILILDVNMCIPRVVVTPQATLHSNCEFRKWKSLWSSPDPSFSSHSLSSSFTSLACLPSKSTWSQGSPKRRWWRRQGPWDPQLWPCVLSNIIIVAGETQLKLTEQWPTPSIKLTASQQTQLKSLKNALRTEPSAWTMLCPAPQKEDHALILTCLVKI